MTRIIVGVVLVAMGGLFTLQGLGYVGGSSMTGSTFWAIAGPIIAALGVALIFLALQDRRSRH